MDIIEHFSKPFSNLELALFFTVAFVIFLLPVFLLFKLLKKSQKSVKEQLKELKIATKESLFTFSSLAQEIGGSNSLKELLKELEPYKFNPNAKSLPKDLKQKIQRYIDEL